MCVIIDSIISFSRYDSHLSVDNSAPFNSLVCSTFSCIYLYNCISLSIILFNVPCFLFKSIQFSQINLRKYIQLQKNTKLNSNPYHYKLKFISTSNQKYNWKFQESETDVSSQRPDNSIIENFKNSKLSACYFLCRYGCG